MALKYPKTVGELIERLAKLDKDLEVIVHMHYKMHYKDGEQCVESEELGYVLDVSEDGTCEDANVCRIQCGDPNSEEMKDLFDDGELMEQPPLAPAIRL